MKITGNLYRIKDLLFFEEVNKGELNHLFVPIMIWDGKKIENKIAILETNVTEDFDYDYDDNLISAGLVENNIYHVISYNPYDGKPFDFVVKDVFNKTDDYERIEKEEIEWSEKRGSKKKSDMLYNLCDEKQNLVKCCPIFYKNQTDTYGEYEKISWIEIVEENRLFN